MNIRDIKPSTLKRLAAECDEEFKGWLQSTDGKVFRSDVNGMKERVPAEYIDVWRTAFSLGASAILRRVNELKE